MHYIVLKSEFLKKCRKSIEKRELSKFVGFLAIEREQKGINSRMELFVFHMPTVCKETSDKIDK